MCSSDLAAQEPKRLCGRVSNGNAPLDSRAPSKKLDAVESPDKDAKRAQGLQNAHQMPEGIETCDRDQNAPG